MEEMPHDAGDDGEPGVGLMEVVHSKLRAYRRVRIIQRCRGTPWAYRMGFEG
jgi:hypothetical protein